MRYSIRTDQWVLVREEIGYIKAYLTLQMERFSDHLNYSIDINDDIQSIKVPSMILQPLVENYFKHCYEEGCYDSQLKLAGEIKEDMLYLIVENDCTSLSEEELETLRNNIYRNPYEDDFSQEHIGLKNIHDRLLLNYGSKAGLKVSTNNGQGFIVELYIPLKN
jgi:two-component system sensor histidine kinase YesM